MTRPNVAVNTFGDGKMTAEEAKQLAVDAADLTVKAHYSVLSQERGIVVVETGEIKFH